MIQWLLPQLFFCLNLAGVITYAITASSLESTLQLSTAQIGSLGGAYFLAYAISQLVLGCSLGPLSPRLLLGITALISAAGAFLLSIASNYEMAMLARLLMGSGFGTALVGVVYMVRRLYSDRFAFMVNLSQSMANGIGALLGLMAPLPLLQSFRLPFQIITLLLLTIGALILLFVRDSSEQGDAGPHAGVHGGPQTGIHGAQEQSLSEQLASIFSNGQFWLGTLYFTGIFASFLAYADLWNIRFQTDVFGHSRAIAPIINSAVAWGLTIGGVVTGIWANRIGFVLPARLCAWAALILMAILYSRPLSLLVVGLIAMMGFCMGAAPLGLAAMNAHVPEQAQRLASPILLTIVFLGGGFLMSSIGNHLAGLNPHAFSTYQAALRWFLVPMAIAAVSSLLMKPGAARA